MDEGVIFLDGRDVRTLKLADLRQTISVLFQDFHNFPLTVSRVLPIMCSSVCISGPFVQIRDNIALGNPSNSISDEQVRLAARLGGADEFIDRLPEGFDTYIERPVKDSYHGLPPNTRTIFGRPLSEWATRDIGLSGGQMQRLAVWVVNKSR